MAPCNSPRGAIYPHTMHRYSIVLLTSVCFSAACRSASVPVAAPIPAPVTPATKTPTDTRTTNQWSIQIPTGTHTYNSISRTVIQKNGDQDTRRDTIEVSVWFTLNSDEQVDSIVLRGTIDSIHSRPSSSPTPQLLPFTALIKSGQIRFPIQDARATSYTCTNTTPESFVELLPALIARPVVLSTSSAWKDSSTIITCSGGVVLTSQRIRSYQVLGYQTENGTQVLELRRTDTSTFSGSGAQGQHQITITGESQGIAKISLEITSGLIANSTTEQITLVSTTSSGQINSFTQQVHQAVRLIR